MQEDKSWLKLEKKPENPAKALLPPQDLEAEQSVLGAILLRAVVLDEVADLLRPEDFYRTSHGQIYRVMLGLYNQERPVDLVTVTMRLKEVGWLDEVGGPVFLAGLSEHVGTAANAGYYAKMVQGKARLRRLLTTSQEIAGACLGVVDDVEAFEDRAEASLLMSRRDLGFNIQPLSELVPKEVARLEELTEGRPLGLATGFYDMDALTGGFQDGDLIIIAARPSMGKTALALNIAEYAGKHGSPGAFFSLEMSKEQLVRRLFAGAGRLDAAKMRTGGLDQGEWAKLFEASNTLADLPIFIDDQPALTPMQIKSRARRLKSKYGIKYVVVDYLQLLQDPTAKSREQEVAGISRSLKALAKELELPVIALSQLNRKVEEAEGQAADAVGPAGERGYRARRRRDPLLVPG